VPAAQFSSQFSASARQVRSSAVAARSSLVSFEDSASAAWFSSLPVFVFAAEGPLRSGLASHSSCLYHQPGACECRSSDVLLPPGKSGSCAGLFCTECLHVIAGVVFELLDQKV
jgi:hypothetical protein